MEGGEELREGEDRAADRKSHSSSASWPGSLYSVRVLSRFTLHWSTFAGLLWPRGMGGRSWIDIGGGGGMKEDLVEQLTQNSFKMVLSFFLCFVRGNLANKLGPFAPSFVSPSHLFYYYLISFICLLLTTNNNARPLWVEFICQVSVNR